jgi:hypothetical protein
MEQDRVRLRQRRHQHLRNVHVRSRHRIEDRIGHGRARTFARGDLGNGAGEDVPTNKGDQSGQRSPSTRSVLAVAMWSSRGRPPRPICARWKTSTYPEPRDGTPFSPTRTRTAFTLTIFPPRAWISIRVIEGVVTHQAHSRFGAPANARIVSERRCACERDTVCSRRSSLPKRSFNPSTAEMAAKLLLPKTYFFEVTVLWLERPFISVFYLLESKEAQEECSGIQADTGVESRWISNRS